jgi:hypothetical protein
MDTSKSLRKKTTMFLHNGERWPIVTEIMNVGMKKCIDIEVGTDHLFALGNGVVVHNCDEDFTDDFWNTLNEKSDITKEKSIILSCTGEQGIGKSWSAISLCFYVDPNFSLEHIYFSYDALVRNRHKLKPHTAVLLDEQTQSYGLDSNRVMLVLSAMKEQLRKKSVHLVFCSPVLHSESATSNYILEVMFIDHETQEAYAALKTREGLTLGHVRIPSPLKILEDGNSFATEEFMKAYEAKKDAHIENMLGQKSVDTFEEYADAVIASAFFKKAEKMYRSQLGYMPRDRVVQVVNKMYPEYHSGVMAHEVAERIRMKMEMSGRWRIPASRKKV